MESKGGYHRLYFGNIVIRIQTQDCACASIRSCEKNKINSGFVRSVCVNDGVHGASVDEIEVSWFLTISVSLSL